MHNYGFFLNLTIIEVIFQITVWKNGIWHQMTLYSVVIVAGEQTHTRLSVLPVKSTIV
jgi:hypothetical protein